MNKYNNFKKSIWGLLYLMFFPGFIGLVPLWAESLPVSSEDHLPAWTVETTYPVVDSPTSGGELTVRWRFQVDHRELKQDGEWWRIFVTEESGAIPDTARFLYQPGSGLIADLRITRWLRGRAYLHTDLIDPVSLYLKDIHYIPVVFVSRDLVGSGAEKTAVSRISVSRETDPQHRYRDTYRVKAVGPSTSPGKVVEVSHERNPGRTWRFAWASEFPWWTSCETQAFSARLISREGVWSHE